MRLAENLIRAGYVEDWKYHPTLSGTPQGGVISPLLSNIYLDRLDKFVENTLIPEYTRGHRRKASVEYSKIGHELAREIRRGNRDKAKEYRKKLQIIPSSDPHDPDYRRLRYVRYADDFLLGFIGPKEEAEEIKRRIAEFLRETLALELSEEKTLITHARTQPARFLGYEIQVQHGNTKHARNGRRSVNGGIALRIPNTFIEDKSTQYSKGDKVIHRAYLLNDSDYSIVARYQSEYRGYVEYYGMAINLYWLYRVQWALRTSLLKTLAHKHKSSLAKEARRLTTTRQTAHGPRKCIQVMVNREGKPPLVAYFGAILLKRRVTALIKDRITVPIVYRNELLKRFLADKCELCGATKEVGIHHIRKLADLKQKGRREKPLWVRTMAARKRKTLVLCRYCHDDVHAGRPVLAERLAQHGME